MTMPLKVVYYESAEESPLRRSVYKIDQKGVKTKLSEGEGRTVPTSVRTTLISSIIIRMQILPAVTPSTKRSRKSTACVQDNAALREKISKYIFL